MDRSGFTLVEVLIVSIIVGILAGIAVPRLSKAVDRAAATRVVADARTVAVATRSLLEAGGALPVTGDWGVAPAALTPYLQENMTFSFRDAVYRFVTQPALQTAQLWVEYPAGSGLGEALLSFRRTGEVSWTPTRTTFFLAK